MRKVHLLRYRKERNSFPKTRNITMFGTNPALIFLILASACKGESESIPLAAPSTVPNGANTEREAREYAAPSSGGGGSGNYYSGGSYYAEASDSYGSEYPASYYPTAEADRKKKPFYSSPYPVYNTYHPGPPVECQEHMVSGMIGDILQNGGVSKYGLLRTLVATISAGLLAKIPLILAIKALIVKLIIVPIGLIVLALPFIMPVALLFYPLWNRVKETISGTTTTTTSAPTMLLMITPTPGQQAMVQQALAQAQNATNASLPTFRGRAADIGPGDVGDILTSVLESDECFERLACQLGARDYESPYADTVTWFLKFLQKFKFVERNGDLRHIMKRYRESYGYGLETKKSLKKGGGPLPWNKKSGGKMGGDFCQGKYRCDASSLYAKPQFTRYSRYLNV